MRPKDVNPIDVIEEAYNLEGSDREWLARIAVAVRPLFQPLAGGMLAYFTDPTVSVADAQANALRWDIEDSFMPIIREYTESLPDFAAHIHFRAEGLMGLVDVGARGGFGDIRQYPSIATFFARCGASDFAALQTIEPGGRGIVISAALTEVRRFDIRTRRLWARVLTHIAAGRRLRAALAAHASVEEAILTPGGKLEHAEGDATNRGARETLRESVLRIEKARGKQRRTDPTAATDAWSALVTGRWSLVDRFERDGRRYVVARRNEHLLPDPRALTPRERAVAHLAALGKSNKLIGYELGISPSTIAGHLATAMKKLGAKSRADLIQLLLGMSPP